MKYAYLLFPLFLNACTYSITVVHTQGTASDVVDETQSAEPDIQADIPISGV